MLLARTHCTPRSLFLAALLPLIGCGADDIFSQLGASSTELKGGVPANRDADGACGVAPDPVEVGVEYTVTLAGQSEKWSLRLDVEDASSLRSFDVGVDSSGVAAVTTSSDAPGPATATFFRVGKAHDRMVARCPFEVVVPCTPTTCEAEGASCGSIDDGCGGLLDCGPCPPVCGDGSCDDGEDCQSCAADCGVCGGSCGDGVCDAGGGEMCTSCAEDCDTTASVCGNGACQEGEDSSSCYGDCGPDTWPAAWSQWEEEVVELINQERAAGTECPDSAKSPRGPLVMSDQLRRAAQLHSWDMSYSGYFSHTSCNGRSPWQRAADQGTGASAETIGGGYASPAAMVQGWMSSPGHCNILMGGYASIGVGFAQERGRLWTAMFR